MAGENLFDMIDANGARTEYAVYRLATTGKARKVVENDDAE